MENRTGQAQIEAVASDGGRAGVCIVCDAKMGRTDDLPRKQGMDGWWLALGGLALFLAGATAGAVGGRLLATASGEI